MTKLLDPVWKYLADLGRFLAEGWGQFWFAPSTPYTISVIRIAVGLVLLYIHFASHWEVLNLIGPEGWMDRAATEELNYSTRRPFLPYQIEALDKLREELPEKERYTLEKLIQRLGGQSLHAQQLAFVEVEEELKIRPILLKLSVPPTFSDEDRNLLIDMLTWGLHAERVAPTKTQLDRLRELGIHLEKTERAQWESVLDGIERPLDFTEYQRFLKTAQTLNARPGLTSAQQTTVDQTMAWILGTIRPPLAETHRKALREGAGKLPESSRPEFLAILDQLDKQTQPCKLGLTLPQHINLLEAISNLSKANELDSPLNAATYRSERWLLSGERPQLADSTLDALQRLADTEEVRTFLAHLERIKLVMNPPHAHSFHQILQTLCTRKDLPILTRRTLAEFQNWFHRPFHPVQLAQFEKMLPTLTGYSGAAALSDSERNNLINNAHVVRNLGINALMPQYRQMFREQIEEVRRLCTNNGRRADMLLMGYIVEAIDRDYRFHFPMWTRSIYFHTNDPNLTCIIYGVFLISAVCFTIGFCTRVANVLAWAGHLSYIHRGFIIFYGVDTVMLMLMMYVMVAPSGGAYSVDAWIRSLRRRPETPTEPEASWSTTFATRLIQLHLCIIYLCAGLAKLQGSRWWDGTAVWITFMHYEFVPFDMSWMATSLPEGSWHVISGLMVAGTIFFEVGFPFLIWNRYWRPLLLFLAIGLHAGIGLAMGLVSFGLTMLTACMSFIPPDNLHWFLMQVIGQPVRPLVAKEQPREQIQHRNKVAS